jgi:hypothetical protein
MNATVQQALALKSLRTVAELSGGTTGILQDGKTAIDRVDEMTKHGYAIGYQAVNTSWDGRYRTITVRVNRPDVTVLYRHGYFRDADIGGFNRRGYIASDRLSQAGNFRRSVNDIKVKASATQRGSAGIVVSGQINLSKIRVDTVNGARVVLLNVALFGFDNADNPMGADVQELTLKMTEEEYARYQKDGAPFSIQFAALRGTQKVRFIVYDFGSDLIGRVDVTLY